MNELALFAGGGGGILGGMLLGWRCVCAVEIDPYARRVLLARQDDGVFEHFPVWDDVRTFCGHDWRGRVDIVTGGFPCQDVSVAGRGAGLDGERSGLWSEMARIIREVRPRLALVENSPALTSRGLGRVLGDLADMGYDAAWGVYGARDAIMADAAPCLVHRRDRIWILAARPDADGTRELQPRWRVPELRGWTCDVGQGAGCPDADGLRLEGVEFSRPDASVGSVAGERPDRPLGSGARGWWTTEPGVGRMAHGVAHRAHRIRAIGNGQVPIVAAIAALDLARRLGVDLRG